MQQLISSDVENTVIETFKKIYCIMKCNIISPTGNTEFLMGPKLCTTDDAEYGHIAQFEMFLTKLIILEYDEVGLNMMKC